MVSELSGLMEDLEMQAAIVRDVTNGCRIANGLGDLQAGRDTMARLQRRVAQVNSLWERIMAEYEALGVAPGEASIAPGIAASTDAFDLPNDPLAD